MNEINKVFGTMFSIFILISSMFAGMGFAAAPVAADNGLGEVTQFQNEVDFPVVPPDYAVQTVDTVKEITFWIHNDEPVGTSVSECIDEIIITFPDTWQGSIDTTDVTVTNLGSVILSNDADGGDYTSLVYNDNSIRIIPDKTSDGVELCPSGTTEITIKYESIFSSPSNPEDSEIMIMTSDMDHNEPSSSYVRQPIDVLPHILVTDAQQIKVEYMIFTQDTIEENMGGADYRITANAKGAWARLDELYVTASSNQNVDVYVDLDGDNQLSGGDVEITSAQNTGSGAVTAIALDEQAAADIVGQMTNGFVKDSEQGGDTVTYFVVTSADLDFVGHSDSAASSAIDPTRGGTGLEGATVGTIISVEDTMERLINVQLVELVNGYWIDVQENAIPIYYTTSLSTFDEFSADAGIRFTDQWGKAEASLLPETVSGVANVDICFPDKHCITEPVGINSGVADSCAITEGLNVVVEAGDIVYIAATLYDQYMNIISNNPDRPLVEFDLTSAPDTDAAIDDDDTPDGWDNTEEENADLGVGDVNLQTSATIGDHVVVVESEGIACGSTTVTGILGQADAVECIPQTDVEITADECFDVLVHVVDKNGNPLENWESLVEISLDQLGLDSDGKYIASTDLREEQFLNSEHTAVMGKLNNNAPAYANIEVCGCSGLGTLDVVCKSDTLDDDDFTLDVINSAPDCIDVDVDSLGECDYDGQLHTSILDTCGNNLVDQECSEGGFASSCVALSASCGVLSTDKTCVDIGNTGYAPLVDLDISDCPCGDITITAIDEPDCCASVYSGTLPMCDDVIINKVGPYFETKMDIYPFPDNLRPDQFYVSERTVVELTQYDECGEIYTCDGGSADVELVGEDCVDTSIQVDSPFEATGSTASTSVSETCTFINEPIYKVVVENCADADKDDVPGKEWTDIPEKDDILVDKFAFEFDGPIGGTEICIYEESEESAGFQSGEDILWTCANLGSVPPIPTGPTQQHAGYDTMHGVYLLELDDRVSQFFLGEYDNQRMGGALIEPGDTKDFYFVASGSQCGIYDMDYKYFQDYNSPDWIEWNDGGHVRDMDVDSERYTRRNKNYDGSNDPNVPPPSDQRPDPYPQYGVTPGYGFGDRVLHNLGFINGVASAMFRDLVAEEVQVNAEISVEEIEATATDSVTFKPQPATQVVARNHGDMDGDAEICDDDGFEPVPAPDECPSCMRECRPAMACSDEGYDVNLQVTDGFQNQVGLDGIKVQLEACMTYPHYIEIEGTTIDLWQHMGLHHVTNPKDVCFDMTAFRAAVKEIINDELGHDDYFATMFLEGTEFTKMIDEMFASKDVIFSGTTTDSYGHTVVYTDADGRAEFRVESDDSSMFNVKSFDTSFRIFTIPIALDADYFDIAFSPGEPYKYDVMALPQNGIPADGEQESRILIRKVDQCGNPVYVTNEKVDVTVDGNAIISRDFSGFNNYDQDVTGYFQGCCSLWPWLEDCSLTVLNDVIETVTVTVSDAVCEGEGEGYCGGFPGCDAYATEEECVPPAHECIWYENQDCNQPDSIELEFVGAPRYLTITEIKHSDLLPADGFLNPNNDPADSCDHDQVVECGLNGNPEICFQTCTKYGNSGGWVSVEVQDKYGERVTGYLGDGLRRDPGDQYGMPDNVFEGICVALDDPRAFIDDYTFGWLGLEQVNFNPRVYCGDLAFGAGSFHVSYATFDKEGQPMDPRETASVVMSVFDLCEYPKLYGQDKPKPMPGRYSWDDICDGQEYDENNLPDSETASRLEPDYGQLDFVASADRWDINADKLVVAADGQDYATLTINPENEYFDVRASMEATVQSSLLGSTLESEYIHPECYVEGLKDPLNPTSIIVNTEDCSGGQAELKLTSTEPGTTRVTVTGNGYGCEEYITAMEYNFWFEETFGRGHLHGESFAKWEEYCWGSEYGGSYYEETCEGFEYEYAEFAEGCLADTAGGFNISCYAQSDAPIVECNLVSDFETNDVCTGFLESWEWTFDGCTGWSKWYAEWGSYCMGFEGAKWHEFWRYHEYTYGESANHISELYTPYCKEYGIIPLTPKTIEIEFKQAYQSKIELVEGWNFFSVPFELNPSNDEWGELGLDVECSASAYWDDAAQAWAAPVSSTLVEPMEGYWCKVSEDKNIPVQKLDVGGAIYLPPTKDIGIGWNDVALRTHVEKLMETALISIDNLYKQAYDFIEETQTYVSIANTGELGGGNILGTTGTTNMNAGQAYFIYSSGTGAAGLS
ncbi:MAG: hypothetical protein GY861_27375 [bacterium]|nr:hypothetical protein [bacterium]